MLPCQGHIFVVVSEHIPTGTINRVRILVKLPFEIRQSKPSSLSTAITKSVGHNENGRYLLACRSLKPLNIEICGRRYLPLINFRAAIY